MYPHRSNCPLKKKEKQKKTKKDYKSLGAVQKIRNAGGVRGLGQFSLRSVTKN